MLDFAFTFLLFAAFVVFTYYSRVIFISFLPLSKLPKVGVSPPMAPLSYPRVEKIISRVTPSFSKTFTQAFLYAPHSHKRITLFFFPLPPNLVDAHSERRLFFYLAFLSLFLGLSTLFLNFFKSHLGF